MLAVTLFENSEESWLAARVAAPMASALPDSEITVDGSSPQTVAGQVKDDANTGLTMVAAWAGAATAPSDPATSPTRPDRAADLSFITQPPVEDARPAAARCWTAFIRGSTEAERGFLDPTPSTLGSWPA